MATQMMDYGDDEEIDVKENYQRAQAAKLLVWMPDDTGKYTHSPEIYELFDGDNEIGRSEDCDIVLNNPSVSSKHARISISIVDKSLYLTDLGSSNKTWKGPVPGGNKTGIIQELPVTESFRPRVLNALEWSESRHLFCCGNVKCCLLVLSDTELAQGPGTKLVRIEEEDEMETPAFDSSTSANDPTPKSDAPSRDLPIIDMACATPEVSKNKVKSEPVGEQQCDTVGETQPFIMNTPAVAKAAPAETQPFDMNASATKAGPVETQPFIMNTPAVANGAPAETQPFDVNASATAAPDETQPFNMSTPAVAKAAPAETQPFDMNASATKAAPAETQPFNMSTPAVAKGAPAETQPFDMNDSATKAAPAETQPFNMSTPAVAKGAPAETQPFDMNASATKAAPAETQPFIMNTPAVAKGAPAETQPFDMNASATKAAPAETQPFIMNTPAVAKGAPTSSPSDERTRKEVGTDSESGIAFEMAPTQDDHTGDDAGMLQEKEEMDPSSLKQPKGVISKDVPDAGPASSERKVNNNCDSDSDASVDLLGSPDVLQDGTDEETDDEITENPSTIVEALQQARSVDACDTETVIDDKPNVDDDGDETDAETIQDECEVMNQEELELSRETTTRETAATSEMEVTDDENDSKHVTVDDKVNETATRDEQLSAESETSIKEGHASSKNNTVSGKDNETEVEQSNKMDVVEANAQVVKEQADEEVEQRNKQGLEEPQSDDCKNAMLDVEHKDTDDNYITKKLDSPKKHDTEDVSQDNKTSKKESEPTRVSNQQVSSSDVSNDVTSNSEQSKELSKHDAATQNDNNEGTSEGLIKQVVDKDAQVNVAPENAENVSDDGPHDNDEVASSTITKQPTRSRKKNTPNTRDIEDDEDSNESKHSGRKLVVAEGEALSKYLDGSEILSTNRVRSTRRRSRGSEHSTDGDGDEKDTTAKVSQGRRTRTRATPTESDGNDDENSTTTKATKGRRTRTRATPTESDGNDDEKSITTKATKRRKLADSMKEEPSTQVGTRRQRETKKKKAKKAEDVIVTVPVARIVGDTYDSEEEKDSQSTRSKAKRKLNSNSEDHVGASAIKRSKSRRSSASSVKEEPVMEHQSKIVPHLMFTKVVPSKTEVKQLKELGASVEEGEELSPKVTHLICETGKIRRTIKLMHAMAMADGPKVVHSEWVTKSIENGEFLDEEQFVPFDDNYLGSKYNMKLALKKRKDNGPLLEGKHVVVSNSVQRPSLKEMKPVLISAGAVSVSNRLPSRKPAGELLVFAAEVDLGTKSSWVSTCTKFGVRIYDISLLTHGTVQYQLNYDDEKYILFEPSKSELEKPRAKETKTAKATSSRRSSRKR